MSAAMRDLSRYGKLPSRKDRSDSAAVHAAPDGTIMIRFCGLLVIAVVVLALIYIR
jgi:hypothetical protein